MWVEGPISNLGIDFYVRLGLKLYSGGKPLLTRRRFDRLEMFIRHDKKNFFL